MTSLTRSDFQTPPKPLRNRDATTTNLIEAFENDLTAGSLPTRRRVGASENTIRGYVNDVAGFLEWWRQTEGFKPTVENLRRDPHALNKALIQDYVAFLEREAKNSTTLHKVSALRAFTNFLHNAEIIEHEPTNGLRLPGKVEPEPRGLNDKDRSRFETVFQQLWLPPAPKRKRDEAQEKRVYEAAENQLARDRAIVFLMLYAGPRVEETIHLDIRDIELGEKSGTLHVRKGKNSKERYTSIPLPARKALKAWLDTRLKPKLGIEPEKPLFVRLRGDPGTRLTARSVEIMVAEAGRRAGIEEPVTPHVLRHTCAFMLRTAGVDIETRAKMLGHSIETASRYGAPGMKEIEQAARLLDDAEAA